MDSDWEINEHTVRHLLRENQRRGESPSTAAELAATIGVSESFVSHILAGRKRAEARILDIAAALGVTDWRAIATRKAVAA